MGDHSKIEWTDATWNPVRGCSLVSAGCAHCYAMKQAHRFAGPGQPYEGLTELGPQGPRWTGKIRLVPELLNWPLKQKKPMRIFVNSMSDLFHEDIPEAFIASVFLTMLAARHHQFQILTKRPQRMLEILEKPSSAFPLAMMVGDVLPNVWLGVSVEDRPTWQERVSWLRGCPAAVRFVSYEPALDDLGPVDVTGLDWLICGGESGQNARPMHPAWARSVRDQCQVAGVPFFFKQWGEWAPRVLPWNVDEVETAKPSGIPSWIENTQRMAMVRVGKKAAGRLLDGRTWDEFPAGTP